MTKNRSTRIRIAFNWGSHLSSASDYKSASNGDVLLLLACIAVRATVVVTGRHLVAEMALKDVSTMIVSGLYPSFTLLVFCYVSKSLHCYEADEAWSAFCVSGCSYSNRCNIRYRRRLEILCLVKTSSTRASRSAICPWSWEVATRQ